MQKHLILYVLAFFWYSTTDVKVILIYFLIGLYVLHFPTSAVECITVGDGAPWKNALIRAVHNSYLL